jgi:hypothetical protein
MFGRDKYSQKTQNFYDELLRVEKLFDCQVDQDTYVMQWGVLCSDAGAEVLGFSVGNG